MKLYKLTALFLISLSVFGDGLFDEIPTQEDKQSAQSISDESVHSDKLRQAIEQYAVEKNNHKIWALQQVQRAYTWQHWGTYVIYMVVVILVFSGLIMAWRQFNAGLDTNGSGPAVNTIEISKSGIKLSSPVLGLIILVISLGFFYLFIDEVYPLRDKEGQKHKLPKTQ